VDDVVNTIEKLPTDLFAETVRFVSVVWSYNEKTKFCLKHLQQFIFTYHHQVI